MRWGRSCWKLNLPVHVFVEKVISAVLKTIRTTTLTGIEVIRSEISHDLPIPVGEIDVLKSFLADIPDVKGFVLLVEQKTTWGYQPIPAHLHDKRGSVTLMVLPLAFILNSTPFNNDSKGLISHRFDLLESCVELVIVFVVNAKSSVDVISTVLDDRIIRSEFSASSANGTSSGSYFGSQTSCMLMVTGSLSRCLISIASLMF